MTVVLAREDGAPTGNGVDSETAAAFLMTCSPQRRGGGGRKYRLPGKRILIVIAAADTDQLIDLIVVGRNVFVADGPRNLPAIAFRAGEIEIGVAQADAAPDVGFAAAIPKRALMQTDCPGGVRYGCSSGSTTIAAASGRHPGAAATPTV